MCKNLILALHFLSKQNHTTLKVIKLLPTSYLVLKIHMLQINIDNIPQSGRIEKDQTSWPFPQMDPLKE